MKKNKKRKLNIKLIIYSTILTVLTVSNIFLIVNLFKLNDIEPLIKTIMILIIAILNIFFIFNYIYTFILKKKSKVTISLIVMIVLIPITIFLNYTFSKVYNMFDDISKNFEEYTLTLVTIQNNTIEHINDIDDNIAVIADENIENGYTYAKEIMDKNNIKQELIKYETYLNIVEALYNGEIKYAFLPSNYANMFSGDEKYINIANDIKVLHSDTKKVEVELVKEDVNKPFSILLMGVDTLSSSYNADTLLLVTFNPDTLGATMLSIPRDTYTKIACTGGKHKINSSGWYSDKCVVDTVSNLVDINIDYYVKINFSGMVDLVDAIGGIDVDVPYAFCEQNSKRQFGSSTIFVEEGYQHLDGEAALALSRNRNFWHGYCPDKYNQKGYYSNNIRNDITRGLNQQLVLKGILNSLTKVRDINTVYELLDVISANISTNMSKDTMLSFYNIFKNIISSSDLSNIENTLDIQKLGLTVYGEYVNISGMNLSMIIVHQNSINTVSNAMKENLGLRNKEIIKTLSFNINNPYEETTIGSGVYGGTVLNLLEDLTGKTKEEAESYCSSIGKECEFEEKEVDDSYISGQIIEQSIPANYDISLIYKPIIFQTAKVTTTKVFDYSMCIKEEYQTNSRCQIPNFTNKDISEFNTWYKNFSYIQIKLNKIEDNTQDNGLITKQSISNTSIYELYQSGKLIEIEYIYNQVKENEENNFEDSLENTEETIKPGTDKTEEKQG